MRLAACAVALLVVALLVPVAGAYKETDHLDPTLSTHQFIMDRLPAILEADGHPELAARLRAGWLDDLERGSIASDAYLWRQADHYMSPITHEGLPGFTSAGDLADAKVARAEQSWADGSPDDAVYYIGWAMEVLEDLTVPHHAHVTPFYDHEEYEAWVLAHQGELPAATNGIYGFAAEPGHFADVARAWDWVDYAAHRSYDLFPQVDGPEGAAGIDYGAVASQMVPLAEALSAGFFYRMMERLDAAPPVAVAGPDATTIVGGAVALDGNASTDDVAIHAYAWRLPGNVTVPGPVATFRPTALGDYPMELVVTDAFGKTANATTRVDVVPPPVAVIRTPAAAAPGESISFDGSGSLDDTAFTRFVWDLGDGTTAEGAHATHTYASPGTYTVTLTVWDASGRQAVATARIQVTAAAAPASKVLEELLIVFLAVGSALVIWASAAYGRMLRGEDGHRARREGERRN